MATSINNRDSQNVPIMTWDDGVFTDQEALTQAYNLASLPFAFHHIALMPDEHAGYGAPVGSVFATDNYIIPNALGPDIGCGMHARRTNIEAERLMASDPNHGTLLKKVIGQIKRNVPVGNGPSGAHKETGPEKYVKPFYDEIMYLSGVPSQMWYPNFSNELPTAMCQIGTLGGGNHFIELDTDGEFLWVMLHSGSRAFGQMVFTAFNKMAVELNEKYKSPVPKSAGLAFLPMDSPEGRDYYKWMQVAMMYARQNRACMLDIAMDTLFGAMKGVAPDEAFTVTEAVDCHHNFIDREHHFGRDVLIARKGAVRAREGELVIIPGSMETESFIARGLGNRDSFTSSPHGAGRRMSRKKAKAARSVQDMVESMNALGIELATNSVEAVVDEAGHAYKDVNEVMEKSADLVEPVYHLRPLGVIKGG